MAEYHMSSQVRLHKIPDSMTDEEATLVEPVSVAYHAIWGRGGGVAPHDRVGIWGAGPIGLFAMQIAQAAGAQVVVSEPTPYRQEMAKRMGAETIIDPSKENIVDRIMELTDGLGLTKIIECSGSAGGIANSYINRSRFLLSFSCLIVMPTPHSVIPAFEGIQHI